MSADALPAPLDSVRAALRFVWRALGGLSILGAWCAAAAPAVLAAPDAHGAPAALDLDAFERMKHIAKLPDGLEMAYLDLGARTGRPVLLVHGYTDSARDWAPLIPYLSPHLRLIVVDLRGHGRSGKPECCYSRFDFAYDLKLLLDALKIREADIVGHSLGSIVAQTFAEEWPQRTRRVVLISSTGGWPPEVPRSRPPLDFAAEIRKLKEPLDPNSPFMIEWWSSPTPVDPDFLRRQREDAARIPLRVWLAVLDQALPVERMYEELQRTLPRLVAPTLLIWGEKDPLMEEPVRRSLRAALPHAEVKVFAGLGHNPFWEDPAGVAAAIDGFLLAAP